jgi:hypothetical protein
MSFQLTDWSGMVPSSGPPNSTPSSASKVMHSHESLHGKSTIMGPNDGSAASSEEMHLILEKMDNVLRGMATKLVPLDKVPEQLQEAYQEVQNEVTEGVDKWSRVANAVENTRGRAAVRNFNKIFSTALVYEMKRLSVGKPSKAHSILIQVCECTRHRIHRLYSNTDPGRRNPQPHNCNCPTDPEVQRHIPLLGTTIPLAKAAERQIECVEAYRRLHKLLLDEVTWL